MGNIFPAEHCLDRRQCIYYTSDGEYPEVTNRDRKNTENKYPYGLGAP